MLDCSILSEELFHCGAETTKSSMMFISFMKNESKSSRFRCWHCDQYVCIIRIDSEEPMIPKTMVFATIGVF